MPCALACPLRLAIAAHIQGSHIGRGRRVCTIRIGSPRSQSQRSREIVYSGGLAKNALLNEGLRYVYGSAAVYGGGAAVISSGAIQYVLSGGETQAAVVLSGGVESVDGGVGIGAVVHAGGSENVYSGGQVFGGIVAGTETLFAGAVGSGGDLVLSSPTTFSGTLTVSSGGQVAMLKLLGSYVTSNFALSTDGHGGIFVADPPLPGQSKGVASFALAMAIFGGGSHIGAGGLSSAASSSSLFGATLLVPAGATSAYSHA